VDLKALKSCLDVSDAHITWALAPARALTEPTPRDKMLALIEHMAKIARPNSGAPRILIAIAKMAPRDWLEGDAVVRLIGDDELTVLTLMVDDALNTQRIAGPLRIDAPFSEFARVIHMTPHVLVPLRVEGQLEPRGVTLRRIRTSKLPKRAPSYSALAQSLMPAMSRHLEVRSAPPPPSPPRKK
jgi:hypothetical protein